MKHAARMMMAVMVTMVPLLASAQLESNGKVVTNVPFEFRAGSKIVPAGQCTVQRSGMLSQMLLIRNSDKKVGLYSLAQLGDVAKGSENETALIFHKYGDQYFLSGIRVAGKTEAYELPETKIEAELRAQNAPASEEVLVARLQ
jgi:hypothetical protein